VTDCDKNGKIDQCEWRDCNENDKPDQCDVAIGRVSDCNGNGVPDSCDVANDAVIDANQNGFPDGCEMEVLFVDARAKGAGNGRDWPNAYTTLDVALGHANAPGSGVREIRISQGRYVPWEDTDLFGSRLATFQITLSLAIRGAFAGVGSVTPDVQNPLAYPTILSGDVAWDDGSWFENNDENVYHVITAKGELISLEALTVDGGNANGERPAGGGVLFQGGTLKVRQCEFHGNMAGGLPSPSISANVASHCEIRDGGGAIYAKAASGLRIDSCQFFRNGAWLAGAVIGNNIVAESSLFYENSSYSGGAVVVYGTAVFKGCDFILNTSEDYGGAVGACVESIEIKGCRFQSNTTELNGGALSLYRAGTIDITGSEFSNNSAEEGGAIYTEINERMLIDSSQFYRNSAIRRGGAIHYGEGLDRRWEIRNSSFLRNDAGEEGGALNAFVAGRIVDSTFFENQTNGYGGAVSSQSASIDNSSFVSNIATHGGAIADAFRATVTASLFTKNSAVVGGAVWLALGIVDSSEFRDNTASVGGAAAVFGGTFAASGVFNSVFWNNRASYYGGAIAVGYGPIEIAGNTIVNNRASGVGGGILASPGTLVGNSILWANSIGNGVADELAQIDGTEPFDVSYSNIQGWTGALGGEGNSGADPKFVNPADPDGPNGPLVPDLRVHLDSPAIDSGDPDFEAEPGEADLDGKPRVLCRRVDRGAYEFGVVGDIDCDRAVTLTDFAAWAGCETGPGATQALGECQALDARVDGAIDLSDFAVLQRAIETASR
jgi:hypothetical protein